MPRAKNRLYAAWLGLEAAAPSGNADAMRAVGAARQLFLDWVRGGRRSYYEPMATAPANVREAVAPLRSLASTCTEAEIDQFIAMTKAGH